MNKNKLIAVLSAMVMALAFVLAGCQVESDSHEHSFSKEWTSDATNHWHAATCEHTEEVRDKAEHTFGEWKTTLKPTEEADGKKERTCTVCSYKEEQSIAKLEHTHTFAETWTSDEAKHWHACSGCEEKSDEAIHTFGEWTVTTEATCTEKGSRKHTCTVCGYEGTEEIAATGHSYSSEWTKDSTNHWHVATCEHTEEVSDEAIHAFGEWTVTTEATCTEKGIKKHTYTVCGYEGTEEIAAEHSYSEEWEKAGIGNGKQERTCSVCSYKEEKFDFSAAAVGDIVLTDGSFVSADNFADDMTAAAVIVRAKNESTPALGVGIHHNRSGLAWCTESAKGYAKIDALTISNCKDGSDSWKKLKAACNDAGQGNDATLYPAWNFCNTYGTTNGLTDSLATGWYLPAIAELTTIYRNKDTIEASLTKVGGNKFCTSYYLSCCQDSSANLSAKLHFDGYMGSSRKYVSNPVCSVRAFN